ncbi:hypothetical protein IWZ01DRAFT_339182 [Phyllosticta capitalensis]
MPMLHPLPRSYLTASLSHRKPRCGFIPRNTPTSSSSPSVLMSLFPMAPAAGLIARLSRKAATRRPPWPPLSSVSSPVLISSLLTACSAPASSFDCGIPYPSPLHPCRHRTMSSGWSALPCPPVHVPAWHHPSVHTILPSDEVVRLRPANIRDASFSAGWPLAESNPPRTRRDDDAAADGDARHG